MTEKPAKRKIEETIKYGKLQLVKSTRYQQEKDLLVALLDPDESYSIDEVDKLIRDYKKGRVK